MEKVILFFNWQSSNGGDLSQYDCERVFEITNYTPTIVSTLKSRAKEIKEKYNYKFEN